MENTNTGDLNTGDWNTGDLNTTEPPIRIFNKDTDVKRKDIKYPDFFFFYLTEWINESSMNDKEKEAYPTYITTGGYLKVKTYLGAWRESWENASLEDKKKCFDLPNWDNEIFKQISGIDVEKELNEPVEELTMEEVCKMLGRNIKIKK